MESAHHTVVRQLVSTLHHSVTGAQVNCWGRLVDGNTCVYDLHDPGGQGRPGVTTVLHWGTILIAINTLIPTLTGVNMYYTGCLLL